MLPIGFGSSFQASSFEGQCSGARQVMGLRTGGVFTDVTCSKEEVTVRPVEGTGRVVGESGFVTQGCERNSRQRL